MSDNLSREEQNKILKTHGYRWEKITQDWLDDNDDFETRPGWHLYAPNNRGEVSVSQALREIEIGVDATAKEIRAAANAEFERETRELEIKNLRNAVARFIEKNGTRPDGIQPDGEHILNTQNIYGGGDWFVIESDKIWYIRNNGMDGDNWSYNNVRTGGAGAIGWMIPMDSQVEYALECLAENKTPSSYRTHAGIFVSCATPVSE
jgi:hypothetical protein